MAVLKKADVDPDVPTDFQLDFRVQAHWTIVVTCRTDGETSQGRGSDAQALVCLPPASLDWNGTGESIVGHRLLDSTDSSQVTLLGLLDLSAAFDTVDHVILIQRLEISFGVSGTALQWIR